MEIISHQSWRKWSIHRLNRIHYSPSIAPVKYPAECDVISREVVAKSSWTRISISRSELPIIFDRFENRKRPKKLAEILWFLFDIWATLLENPFFFKSFSNHDGVKRGGIISNKNWWNYQHLCLFYTELWAKSSRSWFLKHKISNEFKVLMYSWSFQTFRSILMSITKNEESFASIGTFLSSHQYIENMDESKPL